MAAASGTENPRVKTATGTVPPRWDHVYELLQGDPWGFQFFQAVRLLERIQPARQPVGRFVSPGKEVARFGAHTASGFPASQIQDIQWRDGEAPFVVINFMGLTGPSGVMPLYYTELIMDRVRARDRTLVGFLDLFNHRMVSLFYQAWEKYRFTIAYERGERDRFSHHLLDLIGLGTKGLAERQAVPDDSLLFYSGLLSMHTRSASALKYILEDYFDVPVEVEQFVGGWYALDIPNQCCMETGSTISEQLGYGAVVGDEIWDQQSGLRLCLGPLTFRQYIDFLPEGSAYEPLRSITRFFAGRELDFEVKLILKRLEVPECELDDTLVDRGEVTPQLGWTSWVKTRPMGRDPGDCVLRLN